MLTCSPAQSVACFLALAVQKCLHPKLKGKKLPDLHGPVLRAAAMFIHKRRTASGRKQATLANNEIRIANHRSFLQIWEARSRPRTSASSRSRRRPHFNRRRNAHLIVISELEGLLPRIVGRMGVHEV